MNNKNETSDHKNSDRERISFLIEDLKIKLPDIPIQSEDLFYETLLERI